MIAKVPNCGIAEWAEHLESRSIRLFGSSAIPQQVSK